MNMQINVEVNSHDLARAAWILGELAEICEGYPVASVAAPIEGTEQPLAPPPAETAQPAAVGIAQVAPASPLVAQTETVQPVTPAPAETVQPVTPAAPAQVTQPVAPAAPAEIVQPPGVTLDAAHLPWDARIHGAKRSFIANGTWKNKRGVDPALVAQVEGELRAAMAAQPPAQAAQPVAPAAPAVVPGAENPPPPGEIPTDPALPTPVDFPSLMKRITDEKVDHETAEAAVRSINVQGIDSIPLLAARPEFVIKVAEALGF